MITGYKAQTRPYGMVVKIGKGYKPKERMIYDGTGIFSAIGRFFKGIFKPALKGAIKSSVSAGKTALKRGSKAFAKTGIKQATKAAERISKDAAKKVAKKVTKESVKKYGKKIGKEVADMAKDIAVDAAIEGITDLASGKDKNVILEEQKQRALQRGKNKISEISSREKDLIRRQTRELLKEEEARAREEAKKLQDNLNSSFDSVIGNGMAPRLGGPNIRKAKKVKGSALVQLGTNPPKRRRRRNLKKV